MALSIGPKFNNSVDASGLANIYFEGDKKIDERNRKDWDQYLAGMKALGGGIGKARQWVAAEDLKKQLQDKLTSLQDARAAANDELVGLNKMRDEAKGKVLGIDDQLYLQDLGIADYMSDDELEPYKSVLDPQSFDLLKKTYGRKAGL